MKIKQASPQPPSHAVLLLRFPPPGTAVQKSIYAKEESSLALGPGTFPPCCKLQWEKTEGGKKADEKIVIKHVLFF